MQIINGKDGWLEVICGPMFSGKSEELIRRIRRAMIAKQKVQAFKPAQIVDDSVKQPPAEAGEEPSGHVDVPAGRSHGGRSRVIEDAKAPVQLPGPCCPCDPSAHPGDVPTEATVVVGLDHRDQQVLQQVLQLAHVAGPAEFGECLQGSWRDSLGRNGIGPG